MSERASQTTVLPAQYPPKIVLGEWPAVIHHREPLQIEVLPFLLCL